MNHPICLEITHATTRNGQLVEVGAMDSDRVTWRSTAANVVDLYRRGVRFITKKDGKTHEVIVSNDSPNGEPQLRCSTDTVTKRMLRSLPGFPA